MKIDKDTTQIDLLKIIKLMEECGRRWEKERALADELAKELQNMIYCQEDDDPELCLNHRTVAQEALEAHKRARGE